MSCNVTSVLPTQWDSLDPALCSLQFMSLFISFAGNKFLLKDVSVNNMFFYVWYFLFFFYVKYSLCRHIFNLLTILRVLSWASPCLFVNCFRVVRVLLLWQCALRVASLDRLVVCHKFGCCTMFMASKLVPFVYVLHMSKSFQVE